MRALQIKVGLLVVGAAALLAALLVMLGNVRLGPSAELRARFSSSGDLKDGALVKVAGVTVGRVTGVRIVPATGTAGDSTPAVDVEVTMALEPDVAAALRADLRLHITTLGLLGEKYVEIEPGSAAAPVLAPGTVVAGLPPVRPELLLTRIDALVVVMERVLRENEGDVGDILRKTGEAADAIALLATENRARLATTAEHLESAAARADRLLATLSDAIGDGADVRATLANARRATDALARTLGPIAGPLRETLAEVRQLIGSLQGVGGELQAGLDEAMGRVAVLATSAEQLLARIHDGRGTVGALLADQEIYDDLREFLKEIKRHPWRLIRRD